MSECTRLICSGLALFCNAAVHFFAKSLHIFKLPRAPGFGRDPGYRRRYTRKPWEALPKYIYVPNNEGVATGSPTSPTPKSYSCSYPLDFVHPMQPKFYASHIILNRPVPLILSEYTYRHRSPAAAKQYVSSHNVNSTRDKS
ncbi:hypothetical protein OCU04_009479 [Sclerotinia nivalis]|uniref:Uncharacterized protein n=1 Tax=Sclerotinia nivalis TaxID=352851 RepID=A0A9X0AIP8_9HELO|nr:hypothetical protein OCU04_009479 [Sclerotinia nivalis]